MKYELDFWKDALNPAREFANMQRSLTRMFENMLPEHESNKNDFVPACEIEETATEYIAKFDVPGIQKENLKVEFLENRLVVSGERNEERKVEKAEGRQFTERRYGKFERAFTMPLAIKSDKVEAHYENGVLHVHMPKAEAAKPRQITVGERASEPVSKITTKKEVRSA